MIARLVALVLVLAACAPASTETPAVVESTIAATAESSPAAPAASRPSVSPTTTIGSSTTTSPTPATTLPALQGLELSPVAEGLVEPVDVLVRPGDGRIHVVERAGVIRTIDDSGSPAAEPLADLRAVVHTGSIEQGLLGGAFHPDDPDRLFLYHSRPDNDNQLVEYRMNAEVVDPDSARVVLVIDREPDKIRHNGGHVEFGPDGLLYVSVGDGARASVNGQDPFTLLGAILRIDVDGGDPYGIPASNPFADGVEGAPEVFAYGLRNPWRFSIDSVTRQLVIGDVGQEDFEEMNVAPIDAPGRNFGWPIMEGPEEFYGGESAKDLTPPVLTVDHGDGGGCSITGGPVYRGTSIPELEGRVFFADWCFGWIRSALLSGAELVDIVDHSAELPARNVAGFGLDSDGEILVIDHGAGTVSRIIGQRSAP